jgi:hypothetical protein
MLHKCAYCQAEFRGAPSRKVCSNKCAGLLFVQRGRETAHGGKSAPPRRMRCANCHKIFTEYDSKRPKARVFCSRECSQAKNPPPPKTGVSHKTLVAACAYAARATNPFRTFAKGVSHGKVA